MAELVDALELKIEFRKECWFDSGQGHHASPAASRGAATPHPNRFGSQVAIAGNAMTISSRTMLIAM